MELGLANRAAHLTSTMEERAGQVVSPPISVRLGRMLWIVFPMTLLLAITRQSLWIDEGYTVWFASHSSIASFYSSLVGSRTAPGDAQMAFYLLYMWGWVKIFGRSEIALRAANIPFAMLLVATMSWASRHLLQRPSLWVFFCLSPFLWFYLNEARPYVALISFSAVSVVALLAYLLHPSDYGSAAPWFCLIALLLAWGIHILGVFLFPSLVVLMVASMGDPKIKDRFLSDWSRPLVYCSPAFAALGAFYLWSATNGVNKGHGHGQPGLVNVAYAFYEFMGFGGLGPPRGDIRKTPHLEVFAPYWPWLLIGIGVMIALGFLLLRLPPPRIVWSLAGSLLIGVAIALKVSMFEHFQLLGRHLAVFFPMLLITLMLWAKPPSPSEHARWASLAATFALALVWGISDARLVFLSKYEKDCYRGASSIAVKRARLTGGEILWAADPHTAHYYGIQVMKSSHSAEIGRNDDLNWPVAAQAIDVQSWGLVEASTYLARATKPAILVLSKTDLFDSKGGWSTLLQQRKPTEVARLTAFSIYEWPPQGVVGISSAYLPIHGR